MPQKEALNFKPAPRPEQVDDKQRKQLEKSQAIAANDALIQPHRANLLGRNFRERINVYGQRFAASISTPGRALPSSHSRKAPPAVET